MKVAVYFNLHKRQFSVKALEGPDKGKVIQHRQIILLKNVTFKVSEAGRQRVLRERKKNVHAYVIGETFDAAARNSYENCGGVDVEVRYNPYEASSFRDGQGVPVVSAAYACCMLTGPEGQHRPVIDVVFPVYG